MKILYRVLFYSFGLLLMAFGVAFSVNSGLGVSPVNSLPYAISVAGGIDMGRCVILVFCSFIVIQIILLRKEFKPINLLQIVFSTLFGYFVDFAKWVLSGFNIPTYAGKLVMLLISIVLVSLGLVFYLSAEIVPMPMEGMTLAISSKIPEIPFPTIKIVVDCLSVLLAVAIGCVFMGKVQGVREGTIISALLIGKLMGFFSKMFQKHIKKKSNG